MLLGVGYTFGGSNLPKLILSPSDKDSKLKVKNLLPLGSKFFLV